MTYYFSVSSAPDNLERVTCIECTLEANHHNNEGREVSELSDVAFRRFWSVDRHKDVIEMGPHTAN